MTDEPNTSTSHFALSTGLSDVDRAELIQLKAEKAARQERRIADLEATNAALCDRLDALEAAAKPAADKAAKPAKATDDDSDDAAKSGVKAVSKAKAVTPPQKTWL